MTISISMPVTHELRPRITVVGVGGAGTNAVNNMITAHLEGVEFVACNTDAQSLAQSLTERRIQLGTGITQGLGAGARPEIGRAAAEEAIDEILDQLSGSHMVFITAGMGGGTGTGAAPVIARSVRDSGILTVGVVTKPFHFEGAHRMRVAEAGLKELQDYVDTLIVIPNQNLFRISNERTTFADAFKLADNVLHMGVRGVTDLMVMPGLINLDFADIRTVMSEMGKAMMGTGEGGADRRAIEAAEAAISNPLLDEVSMRGARGVLINITGGPDMTLFEVDEAANRIKEEVDPDANIIIGSTLDESMEGTMRVSVVATGIEAAAFAAQGQTRTGADLSAAPEVGPATDARAAEAAPQPQAAQYPHPQPPSPAAQTQAFRLRPQATDPSAGRPFLAKIVTAAREGQETGRAPEPRQQTYGRPHVPVQPPAPASQSSSPLPEPEGIPAEPSGAQRETVPPYAHPSLPPQERFPEWRKVRAPARDIDRSPSLFERVTASFSRGRPDQGPAETYGPQSTQPARSFASTSGERGPGREDDVYEIPAFLRR